MDSLIKNNSTENPNSINKCNKNQFILFLIFAFISFVTISILFYQNIQLRKQLEYQINQQPIDVNTKTTGIEFTQPGVIEGKITINYKISLTPKVYDDVNILVSENAENEANLISTEICKGVEDNCAWLISESNQKRIYGYKLTLEGGFSTLKIGKKYTIFVSTRQYDENKHYLWQAEEKDNMTLQIPNTGKITQDFELTVYPPAF